MKTNEAILAFSQSEKIKAGLIWLGQSVEFLQSLPEEEKRGGERTIKLLLAMIGHEVSLARSLAPHEEWGGIENLIERSLVMLDSGVGQEATMHISKALSRVTNIGQQSMGFLKEKNLL